jgi:FkbM family methyltransferase
VSKLQDVTLVNAAVGNNQGAVALYRSANLHSTVWDSRRHFANAVMVACQTIADALSALPDQKCDLMKVDCEGAEEDIIRSLTPEIAARIGAIVFEAAIASTI